MELTAEEMFSALNYQVNLAVAFKLKFDKFWKKETSKRSSAQMCYFLRHQSLPAAFEGFLYLTCAREMWETGGLGALSTKENIQGPIHLLNYGDAIDQMITLCRDHGSTFISILNLFKTETEVIALTNQIKNLTAIVASAYDNLQAVYPNSA